MHKFKIQYQVPTYELQSRHIKLPFMDLISHFDLIGMKKFGACKFKMPNMKNYLKVPKDLKNIRLMDEQTFMYSGVEGIYYADNGEKKKKVNIHPNKYEQKYCQTKSYIISNIESDNSDDNVDDDQNLYEMKMNEIEKNFWRVVFQHEYLLKKRKNLEKIKYAAGLNASLFDPDKTKNVWNPNCLLTMTDMIAKAFEIFKDLPGVTNSFVYYGSPASAFGLHVEDMLFYAFSYNKGPHPKIWYIIPPIYADKLERILHTLFPDELKKCPGFIQHKYLLLTPEFLNENGIPFARAVQNPGELMILWPRTYHFGFNVGFNQAEAVNFATPQWYKDVKQEDIKSCICSE